MWSNKPHLWYAPALPCQQSQTIHLLVCFHWHLHLQLWPFGSDKWCVRWNFSFSFLTTYPAGIEGHRFHFLSRVLLQPDGYQFQLLFSQSLSSSFSHTYWANIGSAVCLARTLTVVHSSFQSFGSSEVWIWWYLDHFISLWELAYRCSWINLVHYLVHYRDCELIKSFVVIFISMMALCWERVSDLIQQSPGASLLLG